MHDVLVCPGCRTRTADRIDVRTLARAGDLLVCECGRRYPVIDGVPIVVADARGLFRKDIAALIERDLPPEVAALLAEAGPDDAPWPRLLEHLSIYLDAHWGDRAVPPPDGPGAELATSAIIERIAARSLDRVELAVELGCSVGRIVAELARGAERVIGLDLQFGAVRRARPTLAPARVRAGRRAQPARFRPQSAAASRRRRHALRGRRRSDPGVTLCLAERNRGRRGAPGRRGSSRRPRRHPPLRHRTRRPLLHRGRSRPALDPPPRLPDRRGLSLPLPPLPQALEFRGHPTELPCQIPWLAR